MQRLNTRESSIHEFSRDLDLMGGWAPALAGVEARGNIRTVYDQIAVLFLVHRE